MAPIRPYFAQKQRDTCEQGHAAILYPLRKRFQGKTNYNPTSDPQQRPVMHPQQPFTENNQRLGSHTFTGTGT